MRESESKRVKDRGGRERDSVTFSNFDVTNSSELEREMTREKKSKIERERDSMTFPNFNATDSDKLERERARESESEKEREGARARLCDFSKL